MNRIDETYRVNPTDSNEVRRNKEDLAGRARIEAMKSRDNARVFKNTVLRSDLAERFCPEWRPDFALEAIECKAVYDYAIYLNLSCENKTLRVNPTISIGWKVASQEGITNVNKMGAISVRFKINRTTKSLGGPALEDQDMPNEFYLKLKGSEFKIASSQSSNKPYVLPDNLCE